MNEWVFVPPCKQREMRPSAQEEKEVTRSPFSPQHTWIPESPAVLGFWKMGRFTLEKPRAAAGPGCAQARSPAEQTETIRSVIARAKFQLSDKRGGGVSEQGHIRLTTIRQNKSRGVSGLPETGSGSSLPREETPGEPQHPSGPANKS